MQANIKEFIGIYEDVFPEGYCKHVIDEFERLKKIGVGSDRQRSEGAMKHQKNDYQMGLESLLTFSNHRTKDFSFIDGDEEKSFGIQEMFFIGLQNCYDHYSNEFSVLKSSGNISASAMKMQKTSGGGGYHVWHAEQGAGESARRALVYSLYLNSLDEKDGGETEFLYQKYRYVPKENSMIIWPAAFTHPHRGNPILSEKDKYIITGWFYFE